MRTTQLGSLLDSAARNVARGAERLALFELGSVYLDEAPPAGGGPLAGQFAGEQPAPVREPLRIGVLALGQLEPRSWRGTGQPADFFALKGVAEALAGQLRAPLSFAPGEQPFLHPGRAASISVGGQPAGWLGEVHPLVCRAWDVPAAVAFELDAAPLFAATAIGEEEYEDVTTFPPALRDIAVVVPTEVPAEQVRATVLAAGGELLRAARVFDLYEGEQLGEGRKSLALGLELGAADRTLTDEEVDQVRDAIVAALAEIGGQLRE
jgi:phenylalanyl-tRNA synthetase beta chain